VRYPRPRSPSARRNLGATWPACPEHRRVIGACEGWWYCEGEPYHDVEEVGSLSDGYVPSGHLGAPSLMGLHPVVLQQDRVSEPPAGEH
jgi:hypothetical protein